jgi:hypothetical protein
MMITQIFKMLCASFLCVSIQAPSSSKRKKGKTEEMEQTTRARTRGLWDGVCEKVMTYCFKMT